MGHRWSHAHVLAGGWMPAASLRDRHPQAGVPFVRTYRPSELGADSQNWAFAQDSRGLLYVGTAAGVARYDGAPWRLLEMPGLSTVRSLDIAAVGVVFQAEQAIFILQGDTIRSAPGGDRLHRGVTSWRAASSS